MEAARLKAIEAVVKHVKQNAGIPPGEPALIVGTIVEFVENDGGWFATVKTDAHTDVIYQARYYNSGGYIAVSEYTKGSSSEWFDKKDETPAAPARIEGLVLENTKNIILENAKRVVNNPHNPRSDRY